MEKKQCSQCGNIFPLSFFYKAKSGKDGYRGNCKFCSDKKTKEWKEKNRKKVYNPFKKFKKCSSCGHVLPLSSFEKDKKMVDNYRNQCRNCRNKKSRERNKRNRKSVRKKQKEYRIKNPFSTFVSNCLKQHQRRGFKININHAELQEILLNTKNCFYCGCKLEISNGRGLLSNSYTVDLVDPDGIMEKDNIKIVCHSCNVGKGRLSLEEFILKCQNVAKRFF
jgi:hypothetical protein